METYSTLKWTYKNALKNVNLYGPTYFAPIIELINDMAEAERID